MEYADEFQSSSERKTTEGAVWGLKDVSVKRLIGSPSKS